MSEIHCGKLKNKMELYLDKIIILIKFEVLQGAMVNKINIIKFYGNGKIIREKTCLEFDSTSTRRKVMR